MKKLKLYCDPMVAAMGIIWGICGIGATIFYLIILSYFGKNFEEIAAFVFMIALSLSMILLTIYCAPIWFSYVVVSPSGIKWVAPFSEKHEFSYEEFKYVKIAYYLHVYQIRFFLVMSQSFISMMQLTNINQMRNSKTFIKIRITRRRYKKLMQVLPDFAKKQVELAMNGDFSQVGVNIDQQKPKKKRRKKRKR